MKKILSFSFLAGMLMIFSAANAQTAGLTLNPAEAVLVKTLPDTVKVLSLNNSLIYCNGQNEMFNDISASRGKNATWTMHTLLGKYLSTHWDEGEGLNDKGEPGAKMTIRSDNWTHIILQEQSKLPRTDKEAFRASVKKWVEYIREYCPNPDAVIILPVNWAYSDDWDNYTATNQTLMANYREIAAEFGVTVCPVAGAYQAAHDSLGVEGGIETWYNDECHPSTKATYMTACMEYSLIFGEDPVNINFHPEGISDETAKEMQNFARTALGQFTNAVDHTAGRVRFEAVEEGSGGTARPGEISFSVDGGGHMEGNEFVSDGTQGTFKVTASDGDVTAVAYVKVAEPITKTASDAH